MNVEDTIFDNTLPINTLPVLERIKQLLKEHKTNSLITVREKDDPRFDKLIILLILQRYAIFPNFDEIYRDLKNRNIIFNT